MSLRPVDEINAALSRQAICQIAEYYENGMDPEHLLVYNEATRFIKKGGNNVTGCPLAYPDTCSTCVYYGQCPPSRALEKLEKLQAQFDELKRMLERITPQA